MRPRRSLVSVAPILLAALSAALPAFLAPIPAPLGAQENRVTRLPSQEPPASPSATASVAAASDTELGHDPALDEEELRFVALINEYRAANGRAPLRASLALTRAARWMSEDMARHDYFDHRDRLGRHPFARIRAFGYPVEQGATGENIAAGNASAREVFRQWKASPGHNRNMLDARFRVLGIARAFDGGSRFGWYWTNTFGSAVDALLEERAP